MEPFVGRATELAELQSELDLVRHSGRARFVWDHTLQSYKFANHNFATLQT